MPSYNVSLAEATTSGVVTLKVGPKLKEYFVHKALLVWHSEYFRKALNGPWKEAEEGVVKLEDIDPVVVKVFVHWLYTKQLPIHSESEDWEELIDDRNRLLFCVRVYIFADRFQVPSFREDIHNNMVNDFEHMIKFFDTISIMPLVIRAYANMPADCPFLQLLVDTFCEEKELCVQGGADKIGNLPSAFLIRVARHVYHEQHHDCEKKHDVPSHKRCYMDHGGDVVSAICKSERPHMKYNQELEFGYFGGCKECEWNGSGETGYCSESEYSVNK